MTTDFVSTASHAALAEAAGDAALVSLLRGKPHDDEVATAVWWLVAETLRTTVAVRRSLALPPQADDEDVSMLLTEAMLLADAALAELAEGTDLWPASLAAAPAHTAGDGHPLVELQRSTLALSRLLVTHRPTSAPRLAAALSVHGDVLHRHLVERQAG